MFYFGYYIYRLVGNAFVVLVGFRNFLIFLLFSVFGSPNVREVPFHFTVMTFSFSAGHLWLGFRFGAMKCLQYGSFVIFFGRNPYFPVYVLLFICSSSISFSRFHLSASSIVLLLFFVSYLFYCFCLTTFDIFNSFSFKSLSISVLSVVDVIIFNLSNSVQKSGKTHSFSSSVSFSQWSSGVSVFLCFAQKIYSRVLSVPFRQLVSVI